MFKKLLLLSALFAGSAMLSANAAPVLSLTPSSQAVTEGGTFSVSAIITGLEEGGLDEIIAGFDLSVSFDGAILQLNTVSFDAFPFMGAGPLFNVTFSSGEVQWDMTALDSDSVLQGLQGNSLSLGTLGFTALSAGGSNLTFSSVDLTGLNFGALDAAVENGRVSVVSQNGSVPEPATLLLMGLGALGMVGAKRRKASLAGV